MKRRDVRAVSRVTHSDPQRRSDLQLGTLLLWHITKVNTHCSSNTQTHTQSASACQHASHTFLIVQQSPSHLNSIQMSWWWSNTTYSICALLVQNQEVHTSAHTHTRTEQIWFSVFYRTHTLNTQLSLAQGTDCGDLAKLVGEPSICSASLDRDPSRPLLDEGIHTHIVAMRWDQM